MTTISQALVHDFDKEAAFTTTMLEAVPAEKLDWRPHEKSMTLGELAGHLAEMPNWLGACLEEGMDFAAMGDYRPYVPADKKELLAKWGENRATFAPQLDGKDDPFLRETWTMRMGDKVLMQCPRADVIRDILIHHTAHHRGQLSVYLRLLDVPVPSTYGPTADHPSF